MSTDDTGDPTPEYDVKIEGGGLTLERQVSEAEVAKILGILLGSGDGTGASAGPAGLPGAASGVRDAAGTERTSVDGEPEKSIAEYMSALGVSNNPQRLAAIALYHRDVLSKGRIHKDDFPKWFEKAGRSAPANLSRDLKKAVKRNLVAESESEEDHYYPTNGAEETLLSNNG